MMNNTYSKEIANAIKSYLKNNDWNFSFDEKIGLFKFGLSASNKIKHLSYYIDVRDDEYIVYAIAPIGADEKDGSMMANMAEFICRANYVLNNGCFELDMRDGEIRYKCFVDCDGITPTDKMVRNSIYCPSLMFKRYGNGILAIIYDNIPAKEAIDRCEKSLKEELQSLISSLAETEGDSKRIETLASLVEEMGEDDDDDDDDGDDSHGSGSVPKILKTDLFDA